MRLVSNPPESREDEVEVVRVVRVWIDEVDRLHVTPNLASDRDFAWVYRAAMAVGWDVASRSLHASTEREWSRTRWYLQIATAVAIEYGVLLHLTRDTEWRGLTEEEREETLEADVDAIVGERLNSPMSDEDMARFVGDLDEREKARELFKAGDWQGVIRALSTLSYPAQMSGSERKRLEVARRRREVE